MKKLNLLIGVLLCSLIFLSSCKKDNTDDSSSKPNSLPENDTNSFVVTNNKGEGILKDSSIVNFDIKADIPLGIKSIKISINSETQTETLFDSIFSTNTTTLDFDYTYMLKRYPEDTIRFIFEITPLTGAVITKTYDLPYFNKIYFRGNVTVSKAGQLYTVTGYNVLEYKSYNSELHPSKVSMAYFRNSFSGPYPTLSAGNGNGTTFARIDLKNIPDSAITVNIIDSIINKPGIFDSEVDINSYDMYIIAKLPSNSLNRPWSLLKVYYYDTYSQNQSGSTWFRGGINMELYNYPTNQ